MRTFRKRRAGLSATAGLSCLTDRNHRGHEMEVGPHLNHTIDVGIKIGCWVPYAKAGQYWTIFYEELKT